jgi:hypothetical protein
MEEIYNNFHFENNNKEIIITNIHNKTQLNNTIFFENDKQDILDEELLDPTPNIYDLFIYFNKKYFQSTLNSVEIKWSKRMTLCAGLCKYDSGELEMI